MRRPFHPPRPGDRGSRKATPARLFQPSDLHWPQILHVHISPEALVIGQVPARVVGILVNDNIVRIPHPVIYIRSFPRSHTPVPVVHSETAGIAALQPPAVLRAKSALEAPM